MLKCCYAKFWMYGSKSILFTLPLFKKQKSHKFSIFSYPGLRKVLTSAKIIISDKKCCRRLMEDSLKYLCAQSGYDWTKNKEMVKGDPPTYLISKKPNHFRVKNNTLTFDSEFYLQVIGTVMGTNFAPTHECNYRI